MGLGLYLQPPKRQCSRYEFFQFVVEEQSDRKWKHTFCYAEGPSFQYRLLTLSTNTDHHGYCINTLCSTDGNSSCSTRCSKYVINLSSRTHSNADRPSARKILELLKARSLTRDEIWNETKDVIKSKTHCKKILRGLAVNNRVIVSYSFWHALNQSSNFL